MDYEDYSTFIIRWRCSYKCGFIIREAVAEHEEALEFGAGEVGTRYEKNGANLLKEGSIKLPKALKDMLDNLGKKNNGFTGLKVFGIVHSGLTMQLITADRPRPYITRVSRGKELSIPSDVSKFGSQVLPVLVQVWQLKQQVLDIRNTMVITTAENNDQSDSQWLNNCLDKDPHHQQVIPTTSTSEEYI